MTLRREVIMPDTKWLQTFKDLVRWLLGVMFKGKLTVINVKIYAWKKRQSGPTFL